MDHAEAVKLGAVEKYLTDELLENDRGRFEEHFFGCTECAEDVKLTATFIDNLRAALKDPYAMPSAVVAEQAASGSLLLRPWTMRMGLAAAFLLVAVVGYQNTVTIPGMRTELARSAGPQAHSEHFLTQDRSPSNNVIEVSREDKHVSLLFSKIPDRTGRYYQCLLRDQTGKALPSFSVRAPDGEEWELLLPTEGLHDGAYVLSVRTSESPEGPSQPLADYHFQLNFK